VNVSDAAYTIFVRAWLEIIQGILPSAKQTLLLLRWIPLVRSNMEAQLNFKYVMALIRNFPAVWFGQSTCRACWWGDDIFLLLVINYSGCLMGF
jgi:hypothetical protein